MRHIGSAEACPEEALLVYEDAEHRSGQAGITIAYADGATALAMMDVEICQPGGCLSPLHEFNEPPHFLRGDCNDDGEINIADPVCILNWLFGGNAAVGCKAALNTNGDAVVNITDAVSLLDFLFGGGSAPAAPFPDCGPSLLPAAVELGCASPPDC